VDSGARQGRSPFGAKGSNLRRWAGPILTAGTLAALVVIRIVIPIGAPSLVLALTIAVAAVLGGVRPALASAAIAAAFAIVDASEPGQLFSYSSTGFSRLILNVAIAPAMAIIVGSLQQALEAESARIATRRSEDRQQALTTPSSDAIITIRPDGTIEAANPATADMFGYDVDDLVGGALTALMAESLRETHEAAFQRYLETGVRTISWQSVEVTCLHASGREFPAEISFGEYGDRADRRFTGVIRDISGRKHLERQLAQSQRMEAIGRLAGGIAHDFNNMIFAIRGYAELLEQDLPIDLGERLVDSRALTYVTAIGDAADRATRLTGQLLAFSRRQMISPLVLDLNTAIRAIEPMLGRLIGEDLVLNLRLSPETGRMKADPGHLDQILVNLVVNARDATANGGTVTIESSNVELDELYAKEHYEVEPGPYVMLAVIDNGSGMDRATQEHVFEPFFTTKEQGKGTGLGLATIYGLVRQAGGHVYLYSEPGKGSTFKLYFPRVSDPATPERVRPTSAPQTGTESILLVEDEPAVRLMMKELLHRAGYQVTAVEDGPTALAFDDSPDGTIDVLVSDVVMPKMSGIELAEQMLGRHPGLAVVLLSGYTADTLDLDRITSRGAVFVEKPVSSRALLGAVRTAISKSQRSA
jgi:PAS domain S-box-containing protein